MKFYELFVANISFILDEAETDLMQWKPKRESRRRTKMRGWECNLYRVCCWFILHNEFMVHRRSGSLVQYSWCDCYFLIKAKSNINRNELCASESRMKFVVFHLFWRRHCSFLSGHSSSSMCAVSCLSHKCPSQKTQRNFKWEKKWKKSHRINSVSVQCSGLFWFFDSSCAQCRRTLGGTICQ